MNRLVIGLVALCGLGCVCSAGVAAEPAVLKVAVAGLTHDHVHGVLRRHSQGRIQIVGIAESNRALAQRHAKNYGFSMDLVYGSIQELLEKTSPEVVSDYGSIYQHLETVEACAPKGIHVMVEKPLAMNLQHARKMQALVQQHGIHLLTNFETTWYASHHQAKRLLEDKATFGDIRKLVIHDGHPGPIEIRCSKEFVSWLTDPKFNGAGALTDFGCYGANLATWLMHGEKPISVTAVTQQIKPDVYPQVDDEATIILTYPQAQAIVQASWNWNYNRKDIEIHCQRGHVKCLNGTQMKVRRPRQNAEESVEADGLPSQHSDPYEYFAGVVRGQIKLAPTDLSALENNVTVVEILQAAMISAKEGRTVRIDELPH